MHSDKVLEILDFILRGIFEPGAILYIVFKVIPAIIRDVVYWYKKYFSTSSLKSNEVYVTNEYSYNTNAAYQYQSSSYRYRKCS